MNQIKTEEMENWTTEDVIITNFSIEDDDTDQIDWSSPYGGGTILVKYYQTEDGSEDVKVQFYGEAKDLYEDQQDEYASVVFGLVMTQLLESNTNCDCNECDCHCHDN
jgi:hypothetical protein